jgi:hypothetical protein
MSNFLLAFFSVFMHNFFTTVPGVPFALERALSVGAAPSIFSLRKPSEKEDVPFFPFLYDTINNSSIPYDLCKKEEKP